MGYYLDVTTKTGLPNFNCVGGKFFGYLEDYEFENCESVKFLKTVPYYDIEDLELLNVWWSCYHFQLTREDAIKFLTYMREDIIKIKGKIYVSSLNAAIMTIEELPFATPIYFEMG